MIKNVKHIMNKIIAVLIIQTQTQLLIASV